MSRIGKLPITIPAGVTITVSDDNTVTVKGPKGQLSEKISPRIKVSMDAGILKVERPPMKRRPFSARTFPYPHQQYGRRYHQRFREKA